MQHIPCEPQPLEVIIAILVNVSNPPKVLQSDQKWLSAQVCQEYTSVLFLMDTAANVNLHRVPSWLSDTEMAQRIESLSF